MARTNWIDDQAPAITAERLNSIWNHVHDGQDEDGSCDKVDIVAHTTIPEGLWFDVELSQDQSVFQPFGSRILKLGGPGGSALPCYSVERILTKRIAGGVYTFDVSPGHPEVFVEIFNPRVRGKALIEGPAITNELRGRTQDRVDVRNEADDDFGDVRLRVVEGTVVKGRGGLAQLQLEANWTETTLGSGESAARQPHYASNTPIGIVRVDVVNGDYQVSATSGTSLGIDSQNPSSVTFTFAGPLLQAASGLETLSAANLAPMVTPMGETTHNPTAQVLAADTIKVFNEGTKRPFILALYAL